MNKLEIDWSVAIPKLIEFLRDHPFYLKALKNTLQIDDQK